MDEQKTTVYRKKSLDRISSVDQLNDYIKVANPGIWVIAIGVIIFLVGVCIWGVFGQLESSLRAPVIVSGGTAYLFVSDFDIEKINTDTEVTFGQIQGKVSDIGSRPIKADSVGDEYFMYAGGFSGDEWVYVCVLSTSQAIEDGVYEGKAVVGTISPMTFITN